MKIISISVFSAIVFGSFSVSAEEAATVSFSVGKVSFKSSKDPKAAWKPLKKNDKVEGGTSIQTGNGSSVTFVFAGSEFKVYPNTTVVLNALPSKNQEGHIDVPSGFAWFKLKDVEKSGFKATTPASTAGVRGTAFASLYDPKLETAMNCTCHGKVEVKGTANEKGTMVEKGNGSYVDKSGKVNTGSYAGLIEKTDALPGFENLIQKAPLLKNCLSCHAPKGWQMKGITKDRKSVV